ncbi:MAG: MMPL family transporter, partial [Oceanisphaera sp.]|nr:MMPL family transporter [Oceanisphaera sp.]
FGGGVLVASVVLLGLSVLGISRLEVENRFIDYFHDTTEIYQGMEVIDAQLGGTIPLEVIISKPKAAEAAATVDSEFTDSEFADDFSDDFGDDFGGEFDDDFGGDDATDSYWFTVAGMERIKQAHDYLEGLDETGKVLSLATLYELVKMIMGEDIDDLQLALAKRSLPDQINDILVSPYLADDVDEVRINVRVMETSHTLKRKELLDQVRHDLVAELGFEPDQVQLTGMLVLYNNMLQSLFRSQILTLGAVFVAIVMMFMVLFRSLSLALIAIAPNLLAAGAVLGGMGLFGLPLDMMTITIAAITVGIGVDDTIHYVHRFKSEFGKDRDYHATMY